MMSEGAEPFNRGAPLAGQRRTPERSSPSRLSASHDGERSRCASRPRPFRSLLYQESDVRERREGIGDAPAFAADLNLDQVVETITAGREDHDFLTALLYRPVHDADTVRYRQEVFRDLEDWTLRERMRRFSEAMGQVRRQLAQAEQMRYRYQKAAWLLDAASMYCQTVQALAGDLDTAHLASRGLRGFHDFLSAYEASEAFMVLAGVTADCKEALARISYSMRIRGGRVDVSRYEGEPDYSAEVGATFERFRQGAVKDYRLTYRTWPGMNHVAAQVLDLVARLFPGPFSELDAYRTRHTDFFDEAVRRFEQELQFYLAYLDYIAPLTAAGLSFCYPEVSGRSKDIFATETFDLALAKKLVGADGAVICNEFHLKDPERIFVVSGPNQGGKTTFARTFGQLHHLAGVGCPVPGAAARLFLCDQLLTHFEREEDLKDLRGKLEDDLVRVDRLLRRATPDTVVVLNEIFTSTTAADARFLGEKVMAKLIELDLLGVYVTFVDELASLGGSVVSMVSTVVPENPAERTYKVVRAPADGLAYALAIAEKHNVTYERLRARLGR